MVRAGGLTYSIAPAEKMGSCVSNLRVGGRAVEANKRYKVAGWAPVAEGARSAGNEPVWDVVETWLKQQPGRIAPRRSTPLR